MKEIIIDSVEKLHEELKTLRGFKSNIKYRGHSNCKWQLIPKAGRGVYTKLDDKEIFRHWKRRSKLYLEKENYSDWELLSIAQHTGLPTRLLDWTHNPLSAVFFSSNEYFNIDGVFYVLEVKNRIDVLKNSPFDLDKSEEINYYQPNSSSDRIANQFGHFTIHHTPTMPINPNSACGAIIKKFIVKSNIKKELILMLDQYGVNNLTQFPDLEGLSKHLCWFYENLDDNKKG